MKTYRATKSHTVKVYSGFAEVKSGELVRFAYDPGEGWEEVTHGSDTRATRRTVGSKRGRNGDGK